VVVRTVDTVRVEPEPVDAEVEVRSAVERRAPTTGKLVAGSVDPEIVVTLEAFRVRQEHDPEAEGVEAKLAGRHHFAATADGTSGVQLAELAGDDENVVVLLLLAECLEHLGGLLGLSEVLGINLTVAVVAELALALRLEQIQNYLDGFRVRRSDLLPPRDGEPSLGVRGKRLLGQLLVGVADSREQFLEAVGLLGNALGLVARGVTVIRLNLLVGELVGERKLPRLADDDFRDCITQFVPVLENSLPAVLIRLSLAESKA